MSYDIRLKEPVSKETIQLESKHFMTGGTYALDGTRDAWLNITYNYADWYYMRGVFPSKRGEKRGIRTIYGMSGAESIPVLQHAIRVLEASRKEISKKERAEYDKQNVTGYWAPTRQNAIKPLYQLLALAQMRPDGIWEGD